MVLKTQARNLSAMMQKLRTTEDYSLSLKTIKD